MSSTFSTPTEDATTQTTITTETTLGPVTGSDLIEVNVVVEFQCKAKFSSALLNKSSIAYGVLAARIETLFFHIFHHVALTFGYSIELKITFVSANRRRRVPSDPLLSNTDVLIEAVFSGTPVLSIDTDNVAITLDQVVSDGCQATIANGDGSLVDQSEMPSVTSRAEIFTGK